ncbi:MAG TPA: hypothetical protein VF855_05625 [Acidimicrobiales bacterium]
MQTQSVLDHEVPSHTVLEAGDVIEVTRLDGSTTTMLVLVANIDGAIVDPIDGSVPVSVRYTELGHYRVFDPATLAEADAGAA